MENFIVSARKYRPSTFSSVIGQISITTTLKNAIRTNHLAHAYLFCGPRGVGKTTCARIFAKTINCFHLTNDFEACNQCESCRSFNENRSLNIHELDAASNNSVDDIRSLIDKVRIPPQLGKYNVYIIDEVHMLSANAFNAFLKTLEEPPSYAIFILATTEKHKIIPTILSRCQIFDYNRIRVEDIANHLAYVAQNEEIKFEPEALNIIAQKADGGMRDALSAFDQLVSFAGNSLTYKNVIENLNVLDYDYYFKLIDAFLAEDYETSLLIFDDILDNGFEGQHFISGLNKHFRDLLVCKFPGTIKLLEVGAAIGESYIKQATKCQVDFLFSGLDITNQCEINYKNSKNPRLLVELSLLRLCNILKKKDELVEEQSTDNQKNIKNQSQTRVLEVKAQTVVKKSDISSISIKGALDQKTEKPEIVPDENKVVDVIQNQVNESMPLIQKAKEEQPVEKTTDIKQIFTQYAEKYRMSKPRLFSMIISCQPEKTDGSTIEIILNNSFQMDEFEIIKNDILFELKQNLDINELTINYKFAEIKDDVRLMSTHDKFNLLNEKNPRLNILKQKFNLEL